MPSPDDHVDPPPIWKANPEVLATVLVTENRVQVEVTDQEVDVELVLS